MDLNLKDFYFLSHLLNRKVHYLSGQKAGKITDVLAERAEPYPMIIGLLIRIGKAKHYFPWESIAQVEPKITLF